MHFPSHPRRGSRMARENPNMSDIRRLTHSRGWGAARGVIVFRVGTMPLHYIVALEEEEEQDANAYPGSSHSIEPARGSAFAPHPLFPLSLSPSVYTRLNLVPGPFSSGTSNIASSSQRRGDVRIGEEGENLHRAVCTILAFPPPPKKKSKKGGNRRTPL